MHKVCQSSLLNICLKNAWNHTFWCASSKLLKKILCACTTLQIGRTRARLVLASRQSGFCDAKEKGMSLFKRKDKTHSKTEESNGVSGLSGHKKALC